MTINPVADVYGVSPLSPTASVPPGNGLGKDGFLELLVASLRYQDPSEPLSTSELMAQTTQLSTMEQLTQLTQLSKDAFHLQMRTSASELVGKEVTYVNGEGMPTTGVVSSVDLMTSPPSLHVGGAVIPMTAISTVGVAATGARATDAPSGGTSAATDTTTTGTAATDLSA